jgi:hypothetical protein
LHSVLVRFTSLHKIPKLAGSSREVYPITPALMIQIERACSDSELPQEVRGSCAIIVGFAAGALRLASARRTMIPSSSARDGASVGVASKEKHPDPTKMVPKAVVLKHRFIEGTEWWEELLKVKEDAPFLARATAVPGDPWKGGGWKMAPLNDRQMLKLLRGVLRKVCGLSQEQALQFGISSLRKFLPTVCAARGGSQSDTLDLGRWSGSWASRLPGLAKEMIDRWQREQRQMSSVGPYVRTGAEDKVRQVVRANLDAVFTMLQKVGRDNMPLVEGSTAARGKLSMSRGRSAHVRRGGQLSPCLRCKTQRRSWGRVTPLLRSLSQGQILTEVSTSPPPPSFLPLHPL